MNQKIEITEDKGHNYFYERCRIRKKNSLRTKWTEKLELGGNELPRKNDCEVGIKIQPMEAIISTERYRAAVRMILRVALIVRRGAWCETPREEKAMIERRSGWACFSNIHRGLIIPALRARWLFATPGRLFDWSTVCFPWSRRALSRDGRKCGVFRFAGRNCTPTRIRTYGRKEHVAIPRRAPFFPMFPGQIARCRDTDYIFISMLFPIYIASREIQFCNKGPRERGASAKLGEGREKGEKKERRAIRFSE